MEFSEEKLKIEIKSLKKALRTLSEVLAMPLNEVVRDASIKRFEYCFEVSWKTIQTAAGDMGEVCNSPREAIRFAYKEQWIKNPDLWFDAMKARNLTSHTYNKKVAVKVYKVAKKFPSPILELISALSKIKE